MVSLFGKVLHVSGLYQLLVAAVVVIVLVVVLVPVLVSLLVAVNGRLVVSTESSNGLV